MLEVDFELVAFDRGDDAVAELAVKDALALDEVVAAPFDAAQDKLVAEADRGGAGFAGGAVVPRRARLGFARPCSG